MNIAAYFYNHNLKTRGNASSAEYQERAGQDSKAVVADDQLAFVDMSDDVAGVGGFGAHIEGILFDGGQGGRIQDKVLDQCAAGGATRDGRFGLPVRILRQNRGGGQPGQPAEKPGIGFHTT